MNQLLKERQARPERGTVHRMSGKDLVKLLFDTNTDTSDLAELIDSLGFEDRAGEPGLGNDDEIFRIDELVLVRTFTGAGDYTYSIEPYSSYVAAWENVREDEAASEGEAEFEARQFRRYGAAVV